MSHVSRGWTLFLYGTCANLGSVRHRRRCGGGVDGNAIEVSLPGGGDVTVRHQPFVFVQNQCNAFHRIEKNHQRALRIAEQQERFS